MLGQHRIAPAGFSGDLLATPGRNQQIRLSRCQLHLRQHQGGVLALETIHHPVTTRAIQGVADFVQAVNVTDGSRAVMRMSSLASCKLLLEAGLEPVLQMACRDRNRIALQLSLIHI